MDAFQMGPKTSFFQSDDKRYRQPDEVEDIFAPMEKISLSQSSTLCRRRDFLPAVVALIIFVGTFFIGNNIGNWIWPEATPLSQSLAGLAEMSLASISTAGKKITENVKKTDKVSAPKKAQIDSTPINSPEPSLHQSWRELVASMVVGGNKLSLFGGQLWNVAANKAAKTVDWLAYGAFDSQQKMVGAVVKTKISLRDNISGSLGLVSARVASSSLEIKKSTLAMSDQLAVLADFDQMTTDYLLRLVKGLRSEILTFGQQTEDSLIFVQSAVSALPKKTILATQELFWQPLGEKTNILADKTLIMANLVRIGSEAVSKNSLKMSGNFAKSFDVLTAGVTKIGLSFVDNTQIGYQYIANYSGQTSRQVAAVKFLGFTESAQEFFAMIGDRLKATGAWLSNFSYNLWQTAVKNWKSFFGLNNEKEVTQIIKPEMDQATLDRLQEQIKNDLRDDLRKELADVVRRTSANNLSDRANEGLVVMSSTGSREGDEKLKSEIQKMFSDQVTVSLDSNRKAGVVTPVFNPSDNYIFLLTPVKK